MTVQPQVKCIVSVVLGGRGFIGSEVVRQLIEAEEIVYSLGGGSDRNAEVTVAGHFPGCISVALLKAVPRPPQVIYHLAGGASVAQSTVDPKSEFERTVGSTIEVLEYQRLHNPNSHLVYVSSAAIYGNTNIDADAISRKRLPVSHYGLHKKMAEDMCAFYADKYNLSVSIVRPFSVFGPGLRKQLLWDALVKADRGVLEFFGTGEELRDWVYVSNLAELLLLVGNGSVSAPPNDPIDAGTGVAVSVKTILTKLLNVYAPGAIPKFLGSTRVSDPTNLVAGSVRWEVKRILSKVDLDEGLSRYVSWYRDRKFATTTRQDMPTKGDTP